MTSAPSSFWERYGCILTAIVFYGGFPSAFWLLGRLALALHINPAWFVVPFVLFVIIKGRWWERGPYSRR